MCKCEGCQITGDDWLSHSANYKKRKQCKRSATARAFSMQLRAMGMAQRGFLETEFLVDALGIANAEDTAKAKQTRDTMLAARRLLDRAKANARPANSNKTGAVA